MGEWGKAVAEGVERGVEDVAHGFVCFLAPVVVGDVFYERENGWVLVYF